MDLFGTEMHAWETRQESKHAAESDTGDAGIGDLEQYREGSPEVRNEWSHYRSNSRRSRNGSNQYESQEQLTIPDRDKSFTMSYPARIPVKLQLNAYQYVQQRQRRMHAQLLYGAGKPRPPDPVLNNYNSHTSLPPSPPTPHPPQLIPQRRETPVEPSPEQIQAVLRWMRTSGNPEELPPASPFDDHEQGLDFGSGTKKSSLGSSSDTAGVHVEKVAEQGVYEDAQPLLEPSKYKEEEVDIRSTTEESSSATSPDMPSIYSVKGADERTNDINLPPHSLSAAAGASSVLSTPSTPFTRRSSTSSASNEHTNPRLLVSPELDSPRNYDLGVPGNDKALSLLPSMVSPACILPPYVYISTPPSLEIAGTFNVIINLTADVQSPFENQEDWDIYGTGDVELETLRDGKRRYEATAASVQSQKARRQQNAQAHEEIGPEPVAILEESLDVSYFRIPCNWDEGQPIEETCVNVYKAVCSIVSRCISSEQTVLIHDDSKCRVSLIFLTAFYSSFTNTTTKEASEAMQRHGFSLPPLKSNFFAGLSLLERTAAARKTHAKVTSPTFVSSQQLRRRRPGPIVRSTTPLSGIPDQTQAHDLHAPPTSSLRVALAVQKSYGRIYLTRIDFDHSSPDYTKVCQRLNIEYKKQRGLRRLVLLKTLQSFDIMEYSENDEEALGLVGGSAPGGWVTANPSPSMQFLCRHGGPLCYLVAGMKRRRSDVSRGESDAVAKALRALDCNEEMENGALHRPRYMLLCVEKFSWWRAIAATITWVGLCVVAGAVCGLLAGFENAMSFVGSLATISGLLITVVAAVGTISK